MSVVFVLFALAGAFCAWADEEPSAWTNVAGNVIVGEVVAVDATSVTFVTGAATQRVARTVFPASELARMQVVADALERDVPVRSRGTRDPTADASERIPPVLAPVWREFEAKCAAKTVTRGDLIVFKRFVAASALDDAAKETWTRKARKRYQEVKRSKEAVAPASKVEEL